MTDLAATPLRRRSLEMIAEHAILAGRRVVDVGCGDGGLVRALTAKGAHVTGVECGREMLALAHAAERVGDERYVDGVAQALPLPDASADLVVFMNSLHHVPMADMARGLAEAARVVAADGRVLVNEPLPEGRFFQLTRRVEDEVEVRAAAYAAIKGALATGVFSDETEIVYLNPVRMESYESFASRMGAIDPARKARVAAQETTLRALFHELASPRDGAFFFDQPARFTILRRS